MDLEAVKQRRMDELMTQHDMQIVEQEKDEEVVSRSIGDTEPFALEMNNNMCKETIELSTRCKNNSIMEDEVAIEPKERYEKLPCVAKDVRTYIEKERHAIGKGGDADALNSYFDRIQEQNSDFFYDIDLDEEFCVRNVFWVDPRSRATCASLGDVVTFDTTYLTNRYNMPFVAFTGVNHHGQSMLLGCGLLPSEDTKFFIWLFKSWLYCMVVAGEYEETTGFLRANLQDLKVKLENMAGSIKNSPLPTIESNCETPTRTSVIHSPKSVHRKGCPTSRRKVSIIEQVVK
ncbi:hypothetical protein L6164_005780 [Bauhinia variegata]|uniref:Uncharacterized protein n=1 Tax=Bauhinia variegata TaxID=167791 RepID=A0ACB9PSD7_BAUVA|nr:hypothetical protein L6164_005780 [Bauhinia variegata]